MPALSLKYKNTIKKKNNTCNSYATITLKSKNIRKTKIFFKRLISMWSNWNSHTLLLGV